MLRISFCKRVDQHEWNAVSICSEGDPSFVAAVVGFVEDREHPWIQENLCRAVETDFVLSIIRSRLGGIPLEVVIQTGPLAFGSSIGSFFLGAKKSVHCL